MTGRRLGVALVLALMMLGASPASAQTSETDPTIVVMDGLGLERRGLLVEARDAMLAASHVPLVADEPPSFAEARSRARSHAVDLDWRIPRALVHVAGRPLDEVTVFIDGGVVSPSLVGSAQRLNPGEHVLATRTRDGGERHVTFVLAEGETKTVSIDLAPVTIAIAEPASPRENTLRGPLVYGGFGLAAIGLAVGTVAAIASMNEVDALKANCIENRCPPSARDDIDSAKTLSTVSTIGFATALAGAAVGVIGLTIGPKDAPKRVVIGPTSAGLAGAF